MWGLGFGLALGLGLGLGFGFGLGMALWTAGLGVTALWLATGVVPAGELLPHPATATAMAMAEISVRFMAYPLFRSVSG